MAGEQERVDGYLDTIDRIEPNINMIDPGAFYASAAVSLKRIADALCVRMLLTELALFSALGVTVGVIVYFVIKGR